MLMQLFHLIPLPLQHCFHALLIAAVMGAIFFVIGELLPRGSFDYTAFPFAPFKWEKGGRIYLKIGIHRWKDRLPDMSKYVKTMFAKEISSPRNPRYTHQLILETCVAELIHEVMILLSPIFCQYLPGVFGGIAAVLYALGNLPFVLIQRYNRPRLVMLMKRQLAFEEKQKASDAPALSPQTTAK